MPARRPQHAGPAARRGVAATAGSTCRRTRVRRCRVRAKDALGAYGEQVAAAHLVAAGMTVLERNWRCPLGEIDIVARDGDALVVCEVKTRSVDRARAPARGGHGAQGGRLRRLAAALDPASGGCTRPRSGSTWSACCVRRAAQPASSTSGGWSDGAGPDPWRSRWSASRATWSRSRPTSASGVPSYSLVGLPDASLRSRATGCGRRWSTAASSGRPPADDRRPLAGQPAQAGVELRPVHRRGRARGAGGGAAAARSTTRCCSASSGWTAGSGRCAACCRRCSRRPAPVWRRSSSRRPTRPRRRWCPACGSPACAPWPGWSPGHAGRAVRSRARRGPAGGRRPRRRPGHRPDLADVLGQASARYALEVAAAGGHHLLMTGPPGAGKTMLAERLPGLLPPLDPAAALEVTAVHSVAGLAARRAAPLVPGRRSQAPHHTASVAAIVGGGSSQVRPGAASLAHRGRAVPGRGAGVRAGGARRAAPAAGVRRGHGRPARGPGAVPGPVPAGAGGQPVPLRAGRDGAGADAGCTCTPMARLRYLGRLSGPLLDRVDLRIDMRAATRADLRGGSAHAGGHGGRRRPGRGGAGPDGGPAGRHAVAGQRRGARARHATALAAALGGRRRGRAAARPRRRSPPAASTGWCGSRGRWPTWRDAASRTRATSGSRWTAGGWPGGRPERRGPGG